MKCISRTKQTEDDLQMIAFASSPLQMASFRLSNHFTRDAIIIGHRGMQGDLSYDRSILNDARFMSEFDALMSGREVEVFLPHSFNGLFYLCVCHPNVKRISYLDEGRLTLRFLERNYIKPLHPASRVFAATFSIIRRCPRRVQAALYRSICRVHTYIVAQRFSSDSENYPYSAINMRCKRGRILCHIPISTAVTDVETVNLFEDLQFTKDHEGAACCFLHPHQIASQKRLHEIIDRIANLQGSFSKLLLRPHPLFNDFPKRLENFKTNLDAVGVRWEIPELSEKQDVTIELYARGVRVFMLTNDSTVGDTIRAFPLFFRDLRLVEL